MSYRNPVLFRSVKDLSQFACDLLEGKLRDGERIPGRSQMRIHKIGGSYAYGMTSEADYEVFMRVHMSEILKTAKAEECLRILEQDKQIASHLDKLVGGFTSCERMTKEAVLRKFLVIFISRQNSVRFNESVFKEVYGEMEDFFYGDTVRIEVFSPLENFQSDVEEIGLGGGWTIAKMTPNQIEDVLTHRMYPETSLQNLSHALLWSVDALKVIAKEERVPEAPEAYQRVHSTVAERLAAIRLFKNGEVGRRMTQIRRKGWSWGGESTSFGYVKPFWGEPMRIGEDEVGELRTFVSEYLQSPKDNALLVAIRRINYAVERQRMEDTLVDYLVAFESLFLNNRQELSYRLSLRVAANLRDGKEARLEVFDDMRLAYGIRSMIVHGDEMKKIHRKLQKNDTSLREFVHTIKSYLLESVKLYLGCLQERKTRREIISKFDTTVL